MTALTIAKYTTTIAQMLDRFFGDKNDNQQRDLWARSVKEIKAQIKKEGVLPIKFVNTDKSKTYYGLLYLLGESVSAELRFRTDFAERDDAYVQSLRSLAMQESDQITRYSMVSAIRNGQNSGYNKEVSTSIYDTIGLSNERRVGSPVTSREYRDGNVYVIDFVGSRGVSDFASLAYEFSKNFTQVYGNNWKVEPYSK